MVLDLEHVYSSAQALTATADSTNLVDHGIASNLGSGEPLAFVVSLTVVADDTTGDETYTAQLQMDTEVTLASPVVIEACLITITRGDAAGTRYVRHLPPSLSFQQFTQVVYTLGGTTPTVTVDAFLIPASFLQDEQVYADAVTITT